MGVIRFLIHPPEMMESWPDVYRAYISGYDGRVFPTRVEVDGNLISCRRHVSESGMVHVAWPVKGAGMPVLSTSSLCEREAPYLLPLELARGKITQIRDQVSSWEIAGMRVPLDFRPLLSKAQTLFFQAATSQDRPEEACCLAAEAIEFACQAADLLTWEYGRLRLMIRRQRTASLPAALGCHLGLAQPGEHLPATFHEAFTAATVCVNWRNIEPNEGEYHWELSDSQVKWCQEQKLLTLGGPLLDLAPEGLPGWLWNWEHDFFNLQSFVCDFVETAITRYVGSIRQWEILARPNTGGALTLSEQNRLNLAIRTLEVARQVDDEIQLMVRIDQPWGSYQARGHHKLSPFQFVDALLRSGAPLSGINLEIAVGYRPRGTGHRDMMDFSQLIDLWGTLGLPLFVTLSFPSGSEQSEQCVSDLEVGPPQYPQPWSNSAQATWVDQFLPVVLAKQPIMGVLWGQYSDQVPHDFPHAGLIDASGQEKPVYEEFRKYRRRYWDVNRHPD